MENKDVSIWENIKIPLIITVAMSTFATVLWFALYANSSLINSDVVGGILIGLVGLMLTKFFRIIWLSYGLTTLLRWPMCFSICTPIVISLVVNNINVAKSFAPYLILATIGSLYMLISLTIFAKPTKIPYYSGSNNEYSSEMALREYTTIILMIRCFLLSLSAAFCAVIYEPDMLFLFVAILFGSIGVVCFIGGKQMDSTIFFKRIQSI